MTCPEKKNCKICSCGRQLNSKTKLSFPLSLISPITSFPIIILLMSALPLIRISPSEFQFAVSRSGYTSRLRLTCLQQQPVGFKFKTNAPHKFLVKPVVWALTERGAVVDVVVRSTSPVTDDDRFLIQTVALAAEEAVDLDSAKVRTKQKPYTLLYTMWRTKQQHPSSIYACLDAGATTQPTLHSLKAFFCRS